MAHITTMHITLPKEQIYPKEDWASIMRSVLTWLEFHTGHEVILTIEDMPTSPPAGEGE